MPTGTVKRFFRSKGYGFIRPEGGGRDVFVHRTALETAGFKELRAGQRIGFDLGEDQGKPTARNLRLLEIRESERGANLVSFGQQTKHDANVMCEKSNKNDRKPITRTALEQSLTDAVRNVAPECHAFVGLIVERVVPETPGGVNWIIKGVRYGRANRDKCQAALGASLQEKQREYTLTEDQVDPS